MENCPDCGTHLTGGWVQRTREVIELPVVPVQVTEHIFIARTCPACRRRCIPPAQLDGAALGRQRLGVNVLSRIATLREEGRLPIHSIQWYLRTVHQLRLSVGAIVSAIHQTAQQAQPAMAGMVDCVCASPVVHADETGWRQNGNNGYVWTFSTPTERYCPGSSQGQALLRDIHDQRPSTPKTPHWADGPRQSPSSMSQPKPATITSQGKDVLRNWPESGSCWPSAALSGLTRRLSRASCAGASSASSRAGPVLDTGNSSSSWANRTCQRTTTPPSGAGDIWLSATRSAAAPARNVVPRAR